MRRPRPPPQHPPGQGRRVKAAGFPRQKWFADFDFDANPNVNSATINSLASCVWVRKGEPLCLIGDSGTGKSHLLIGLGTAAAEAGFRVRYTLATKLVNELVEAADEKLLAKTIARFGGWICSALMRSATWNSTNAAAAKRTGCCR
jgi:DNA replication protein DnaC